MYDAAYTKKFYNTYGAHEWARLETTPYGRLQAIIHDEFLKRYIKPGDRVLDAGSGPGRFSITAARAGASVTVLDISDKQLELAKRKIAESGLSDKVTGFIEGDICDLSVFPDDSFDLVICYGGALTYVCERREKASKELLRVLKQGGVLLISVMSLGGPAVGVAKIPDMTSLREPDISLPGHPGIWQVLETGDLPGIFSPRAKMLHAPMHLFKAAELQSLFSRCRLLEIAGSNVTISEFLPLNEELVNDPAAWATLVELERRLNHDPGLLNCGSHIIIAVQK